MNNGMLRRCRVLVAVVLVAATALASPTGATPTVGAAPAYVEFTGTVDEFYQVPDPLPPGAPGELIRVQPISSDAARTTVRIMYHSVDGAGQDRAVTGKITYPNAPAPTGGWPVMTIANGTIGLGSQCALSRHDSSVYDFGIGGVAVASDYIGTGPPDEVQAYLGRASEAHSVLDAVRAAQNLAATGAGSEVVVLGGSQGGHGALATNELAASYAPELDVRGTVSLAPAAVFDRTYGPLDEVVTTVITAMGLVALASEHPEIVLSDYAGPAGLAALDQIRTQCRNDIIGTVLGVPGGIFTNDPRDTEPAKSIMMANDVGHVAAPSPVLLIQGTADDLVSPLRTDDLFARMCDAGQVTEYVIVPGATHDDVTQLSMDQIQPWLADRLAGLAPTDDCAAAPPPTNSTVPTTTVPSSVTPTSVESTTTTTDPAPDPTTTQIAGATTAPEGHGPQRPDPTSGELAATGSALGALGAAAAGLVAAGVVLVAAARRRFSRPG